MIFKNLKKIQLVILLSLCPLSSCSSQDAPATYGNPEVFGEDCLGSSSQFMNYPGNLAYGKIKRIEAFPSKHVRPRNVDVWLPPDYTCEKVYPVMYMHDGQMLFDASSTWNGQEWKVDETLGSLLVNDEIEPIIVVAIWNHSDIRFSDYFPKKPFDAIPDSSLTPQQLEFGSTIKSDGYLKFIVHELKPFIDSHFSTLKDAANTFIAGSSMGGLISMYALCEYPETFGGAACLSTHWIGFGGSNQEIPHSFFNYMRTHIPMAGSHRLYFDYGTETLDAQYLPFQKEVDKVLQERGYSSHDYRNLEFARHDHSENSWNQRFHIPLKFLMVNTKD